MLDHQRRQATLPLVAAVIRTGHAFGQALNDAAAQARLAVELRVGQLGADIPTARLDQHLSGVVRETGDETLDLARSAAGEFEAALAVLTAATDLRATSLLNSVTTLGPLSAGNVLRMACQPPLGLSRPEVEDQLATNMDFMESCIAPWPKYYAELRAAAARLHLN